MQPITYEEYLQHHGILGMKWGKRNGPPYPLTSSQMSSSERRQNEPKSAKDMSDEELVKSINRLRREKEYEQLTAPPPSKAKKWIKGVLVGIGGIATTTFVGYVGKKIGVGGGRALTTGVAAGATFVKEALDLLGDKPSIYNTDYARYWPTPDEEAEWKKEKKK